MAVEAVVLGASAGGVALLHQLLPQLPSSLPYPLFLVQHRQDNDHRSYLCETLNRVCNISVIEAEDKMEIRSGCLYVAPVDYHLLIESPQMMALSLDAPLHYCRPAIDALFISAAEVFSSQLVGAIFSGMGDDGALGLQTIRQFGGRCMIQSPATTEYPSMPSAALKAVPDGEIFTAERFYRTLSTNIITHPKGEPQ